jgi:hypothetical protein
MAIHRVVIYMLRHQTPISYQCIGGTASQQIKIYFVPPINCATPNSVDNIPYIQSIGIIYLMVV